MLKGRVLIGDEAFAVLLADDLCDNLEGEGVLKQMMRVYEKYRCSIVAVQEVDREDISRYGVVSGRALDEQIMMVDDMIEKPEADEAPSNLAIIGRYILTPDIFEKIERTEAGKGGEIQITDALRQQAKEGMVMAYRFEGCRFDCGSVDGFVEATNYFYERMQEHS
jgi:UTP--glucose-1-phosphate uridylyltransferase